MLTQKGANTYVVGITGNFDDAQTGVKKMFNDKALAEKLDQTLVINFLLPTPLTSADLFLRWFTMYMLMRNTGKTGRDSKQGEEINVVVPTGNFGNILAAYYAKQMGVPIGKFICASNENKVLYDFFRQAAMTETENLC